MSTYELYEFWKQEAERQQLRVQAACRALGSLQHLTGPDFTGNPRTRLPRIRDAVAQLRDGLGFTPDLGNESGGEHK